jgi:hypothetical protein
METGKDTCVSPLLPFARTLPRSRQSCRLCLEVAFSYCCFGKKKRQTSHSAARLSPRPEKKKRAPRLCLPTLIYSPLSLASDLPSCCTTGGSPQIVQISLNNTKQISAARTFAAQRVTSTVVAPDDSSATQTDSVPHRL